MAIRLTHDKPEAEFDPVDYCLQHRLTSELQQIYTIITGIKEDAGNFRRKVKDKVEETDEFTSNKAHRPSKLYKKRVKEY